MTWQTHITTDPDVLAGKPVVRGTRLAVDFLHTLFAAGWTTDQVLASYPQLTPEALELPLPTRLKSRTTRHYT